MRVLLLGLMVAIRLNLEFLEARARIIVLAQGNRARVVMNQGGMLVIHVVLTWSGVVVAHPHTSTAAFSPASAPVTTPIVPPVRLPTVGRG